MNEIENFLEWLHNQEGYYVKRKVVESEFPNLEFNLFGATLIIDDHGDTLVPKRDYRHAVTRGYVQD